MAAIIPLQIGWFVLHLHRIFEASTSVSEADSDQLNPAERLWKVSRRADCD